ncbi:SET and MYND domain-containing protein 4 [Spea bombifrons]|uniref:SET and MYND domain-containing protein 4 n=1 Tax=Spea bombifrons TaxID=233779 RepID=UPI00234B25E1|nr:SET and MYND domain-containing protein 4 [Spea bombifrons]
MSAMEHPVQEWQDWVHQKWSQLDSYEKGKWCWSMRLQAEEDILDRLSRDLSVRKDPCAVLFYKQEGNKRFGKKQYTAAAVLYSKAISHANPGTEDMAVCYANRSAVLLHLSLYSACLEDIERAKEHGIPERIRNKIIHRQAECLERLRQSSSTKCDQPNRGLCTDDLVDKLEELHLNSNSRLTNSSSSLTLQFSTSKGRHLVASQDIQQGETMIWEDAYVSVIIPDRDALNKNSKWDITITNCDLYCHHCLQRLVASLPCQHCSFAKYCSRKCLDNAWKNYHYAECSLGGVLLALGVFCQTALRAVLVAGIRQVSKHIQDIKSAGCGTQDQTVKGTTDGKYCSNYEAVVHLLPHVEQHKEEVRLLCGFTAAALCKKLCVDKLRESPELLLYGKPVTTGVGAKNDSYPELRVLGPAILRHIFQLQCNAQAVTVLHEEYEALDSSPVERTRRSRLATAMYPVLSLLNHSCDPNTNVSFRGRCAVVRASRPIRRGEEVTHCYGPHSSRLAVGERQKLLKAQYFFACQCEACIQELCSIEKKSDFCCAICQSLLKGQEELQCPNATCTNGSISHQIKRDHLLVRLQQLEHTVHMARDQLHNNHIDVAIKILKSCSSEATRFLSPSHMLLGEIFDQLAQCEATKGNWKSAALHLQKSIKLVENHYGSSSLELGHELFKLAQILFNGCEVADAMTTILKAQQILSTNYGSDHSLVQELQQMRTCLLQLPAFSDS